MDGLLDDNTDLVVFCLAPESDDSSKDVSDKSSGDDEDEESDNISIYFRCVWTRSFSFAFSIAAYAACWSSGTCCSLFIQASISDFSFVLLLLLVIS